MPMMVIRFLRKFHKALVKVSLQGRTRLAKVGGSPKKLASQERRQRAHRLCQWDETGTRSPHKTRTLKFFPGSKKEVEFVQLLFSQVCLFSKASASKG